MWRNRVRTQEDEGGRTKWKVTDERSDEEDSVAQEPLCFGSSSYLIEYACARRSARNGWDSVTLSGLILSNTIFMFGNFSPHQPMPV